MWRCGTIGCPAARDSDARAPHNADQRSLLQDPLRHASIIAVPFMQGSCGLGVLDKVQYPNWNVVALSPLNRFRSDGPQQACG